MCALTVKWDNQPVLSRATARRPQTAYLRGIIADAKGGLEDLKNMRCLAWGDTDNLEDLTGKVTEITADLRDMIEVDEANQKSLVLANIKVTKTFNAEEASRFQGQLMLAQMGNLSNRGARKIARPNDPLQTERRIAGELGSPAQTGYGAEAAAAALGGQTAPFTGTQPNIGIGENQEGQAVQPATHSGPEVAHPAGAGNPPAPEGGVKF